MSKLTKQHFIDAAERIRDSNFTRRERTVLTRFCTEFFRHWNPEFDRSRFEEACSPSLIPKGKSGGLKKAIAKYKHPSEVKAHISCDWCGVAIVPGGAKYLKGNTAIGQPAMMVACPNCPMTKRAPFIVPAGETREMRVGFHDQPWNDDICQGAKDALEELHPGITNEGRGLCKHGAPYKGRNCKECARDS